MDHFYKIGRDHKHCQDYAVSGSHDLSGESFDYAIIADGCSGSPDSDVGARILSLIAAKSIDSLLHNGQKHFAVDVLERANEVVEDHLLFDNRCLDATLGIVYRNQENIHVNLFGDGVVAYKSTDGSWNLFIIEYPKECPFYISYYLTEDRLKIYEQEQGKNYTVKHFHYDKDGKQSGHGFFTMRYDQYFYRCFPTETIDYVAVFSDGIDSFYHEDEKKKRTNIPLENIAHNFCLFKNYNGEFVQRRLNMALKKLENQDIHHFDDISCAALGRKDWENEEDSGQLETEG